MATVESIKPRATIGDAAVDGLWAGLGAGLGMLLYWIVAGFVLADRWTTWLAQFDLSGARMPITGGLTILAIGAVYGVFFGILVWLIPPRWRPLPGWLLALVYTLILLLLAETIFLPRMDSPVRAIPQLPMLLGHILYGLGLGWLIQRAGTVGRP